MANPDRETVIAKCILAVLSAFLVFMVFMVFMFCITSGYESGIRAGVDRQRAEAIEAGVARWEVDPKTGETTFRHIAPEPGGSE